MRASQLQLLWTLVVARSWWVGPQAMLGVTEFIMLTEAIMWATHSSMYMLKCTERLSLSLESCHRPPSRRSVCSGHGGFVGAGAQTRLCVVSAQRCRKQVASSLNMWIPLSLDFLFLQIVAKGLWREPLLSPRATPPRELHA